MRGFRVTKLPDDVLELTLQDGWDEIFKSLRPMRRQGLMPNAYETWCKAIGLGVVEQGFLYVIVGQLRYLREVSTGKQWWLSIQAVDALYDNGQAQLFVQVDGRSLYDRVKDGALDEITMWQEVREGVRNILSHVPANRIDSIRDRLVEDLNRELL